MLDRDLEESEEQYQMALRSHLLNVDGLIDLQDARLLGSENEFEHDLRVSAGERGEGLSLWLLLHAAKLFPLYTHPTCFKLVSNQCPLPPLHSISVPP